MAIDTGIIDAADKMSKTYLGAVQPIVDAIDPYTRQQTATQRRIADLMQKKQEAQANNDINDLGDAAKKRQDIQNILQASQSYDANGNLQLDSDKFVSGVEALYPEEAQKIRKEYLANNTAESNLDIKDTEADESTLQSILDLSVLGRDVPQARDFVINTAKKNNPELGALLEQHKDNEDFWKGAAAQSKKNLDLLKNKNDTDRIQQRNEELDLQRTRANQGQQRINQKGYDPSTGVYTSVGGALPYSAGGNPPAQSLPTPQDMAATGGNIAPIVPPIIGGAGSQPPAKPQQKAQVPAVQAQPIVSPASIPPIQQAFVGTPKEEQKQAIKEVNDKKALAENARKNNEQIEIIRQQIKDGAYTGRAGVAFSKALEYVPQALVPDEILNKVAAGQVLDKEAMGAMISGLKNAFPGRIFVNEFNAWANSNVNRKLNDRAIDQLLGIVQKSNNRAIKDGDNAAAVYEQKGNLRGFQSSIATEQKAAETNRTAAQNGAPVAVPKKSTSGGLPRVNNQQQYNALPSGTRYIAPDGSTRTKG